MAADNFKPIVDASSQTTVAFFVKGNHGHTHEVQVDYFFGRFSRLSMRSGGVWHSIDAQELCQILTMVLKDGEVLPVDLASLATVAERIERFGEEPK